MAVPEDIATLIRIQAVIARMSLGDYVASLIPRDQVQLIPTPSRPPKVAEGGSRPPRKAPGKLTELPADLEAHSGTPWTPDRLQEALSAAGYGSQARLAKDLGIASAAVRGWLQNRIPPERWSALDEYFASAQKPAPDGE